MPAIARCLLFLLCLPVAALHAAEPAARVASMNLCSDQLLLQLAEPEQIVSLSYLSANPDYSPLAERVDGIHLNHGLAEELLPLRPDLILTGQFSATLAANLLERMDYEVLRLPVAANDEQVYAQISTVASRLGKAEQGQQLVASLRDDIGMLRQSLQGRLAGRTAVFFSSNGFSYGRNTLQHHFIETLGMHNAAAGLNGPALLSLETLLASEPDLLFINSPSKLDAQLAHPLLRHPALKALGGRMQTIVLPDRHFQCAGPGYLDAYRELARLL